MDRGPEEEKEVEEVDLSDGEIYKVCTLKDLCKEDRFSPPKKFLQALGAKRYSIIAYTVKKDSVEVEAIIDPDKREDLKISKKDRILILKYIENNGVKVGIEQIKDRDLHLLRRAKEEKTYGLPVKSQGRCGTKNQLLKILEKAGIDEEDFLALQFIVKKDKYGKKKGKFRFYRIDRESLIYPIYKDEERINAALSTS